MARSPWRDRAARAARLGAVVIGAEGLWRLASAGAAYLRSPYSADYGEGTVLVLARLLAEGRYFGTVDAYPMVHAIYPPLFPALVHAGFAVLGEPVLWLPRLLSLLATLAVVLLLAGLLREEGHGRLDAALWGTAFVLPWFVQTWAPRGRVDLQALAFTLAGLALHRAATRERRRGRLVGAWLFFAFAFFTRHSAVLAPCAVLLDGLLDPTRRRRVPGEACLGLALIGGPLLVLHLATGGASSRHLFVYTVDVHYEWGRALSSLGQFASVAGGVAVLPLAVVACRGPHAVFRQGRALVLYGAMAMGSFAAIAKSGAAQNYMIEPWLGLLLIASVCWRTLDRPGLFPGLLLLVALAAASFAGRDLERLPRPIRAPHNAWESAELDRLIRGARGPVLSENLAALVLARRQVWVDPVNLPHMERRGHADLSSLRTDCRARRFALVVDEYRLRAIPGLRECMVEHYEPVRDLGRYRVSRPRPRVPAPE